MRLESFPDIEVTINPKLLKKYPELKQSAVIESFILKAWPLPILGSNYYLPGMGTTRNEASPSAINFNGRIVDIFAKSCEVMLAEQEFRNSQVASKRKINTPFVMALIKNGDSALLVEKLMHSVEPLSARSLDYGFTNSRVYSPRDLLIDFTEFIADFHSKGLVHGDLHLGNIGFQFREEHPPKKIIFDLETSFILQDYELVSKNRLRADDKKLFEKIDIFELMARNDLGTFLAYLTDRHFPISEDELLVRASKIYLEKRRFSYGMLLGQEFSHELEKEYKRVLKSLRRLDEDYNYSL